MKPFAVIPGLFALLLAAAAASTGLPQSNGALSADEVRALLARVVANQHRNDEALLLYERREHRVSRKKEQDADADEDKLYRVVPTGTGTVKLIIEERGRPVNAAFYREQLVYLEQALAWALDPAESKQKARVQKFNRRARERHDLVEAARDAFTCVWAGREERSGRALVRLDCSPDAAFKPRSRTEDIFQHARAIIWVDPQAAQLARIEGELQSDVRVGAGLIGKVYAGGRFVMEQSEVAPGVWLPALFQYNFRGRRFVFGFELHEVTRVTQYARIGRPAEALAAIRAEMKSSGEGLTGRP